MKKSPNLREFGNKDRCLLCVVDDYDPLFEFQWDGNGEFHAVSMDETIARVEYDEEGNMTIDSPHHKSGNTIIKVWVDECEEYCEEHFEIKVTADFDTSYDNWFRRKPNFI